METDTDDGINLYTPELEKQKKNYAKKMESGECKNKACRSPYRATPGHVQEYCSDRCEENKSERGAGGTYYRVTDPEFGKNDINFREQEPIRVIDTGF